jgi:hypothetical protein
MTATALRRRILNLETVIASALIPDYLPLTPSEIADIERRARAGETLSSTELSRVERQSPIVDGELLMTCRRGRLFLKRYIGIDLAEV